MQSDIIAHFHGLFGGKTRRKMTDGEPDVMSTEHISIGAYLADKFRRKSESAVGVGDLVNNKINSGSKTTGINLIRIAKLDFKLNLKRLSLHDDIPPELPVRHFPVDGDEDLPPPIPERKGSLEMIIDEDFQGRFSFRPISTVPLPETFSGIKKTYPSKTPRRNVIQRPPSQPPPPPPPQADELPTSKSMSVTFHLPSSHWSSQFDDFDDDPEDDFPPPPTPYSADVISIKPTETRKPAPLNQTTGLPPPPARPPPPAPQTKKPQASLLTFTSQPSLVPTVDTVQSSGSPKFIKNTSKATRMRPDLTVLKSAKSEPNLVTLNSAAGTMSPPPIPIRPPLLSATKQPINGLREFGVPPVVLPNKDQPKQQPPKLPLKPASKNPKGRLNSEENPNKLNGPGKDFDSKSLQPPSEDQTLHLPPPLPKSPLLPRQGQLSPGKRQYPNRSRPLPCLPKPALDKRNVPIKKWAEPEVYDPREEEGDLYDVMDSTNM